MSFVPTAIWAIPRDDDNNFSYYKYIDSSPEHENKLAKKIIFNKYLLEYDMIQRGKLKIFKYIFDLNEYNSMTEIQNDIKKYYNDALNLGTKFITITGIYENYNVIIKCYSNSLKQFNKD